MYYLATPTVGPIVKSLVTEQSCKHINIFTSYGSCSLEMFYVICIIISYRTVSYSYSPLYPANLGCNINKRVVCSPIHFELCAVLLSSVSDPPIITPRSQLCCAIIHTQDSLPIEIDAERRKG